VLLVVGHPSIGTALETLLRIEDRYEIRRSQSLEQVGAGLEGWTPDIALVDGVLAQAGRVESFLTPAIVLSGTAADGKRLAARMPVSRGWLRKDATAEELRVAIDAGLDPSPSPGRSRVVAIAIAGLVVLVGLAMWLMAAARG